MICPICRKESLNGMSVEFVDKLIWVRCPCGCVYQDLEQNKPISNNAYEESYKAKKFYEASAIYPITTYFPLIEELTYGRRLLEVNSPDLLLAKEAAKRGWVAYATTKNEQKDDLVRVLVDDFETIELPKEIKFDCIYAYHFIDKVKDPFVILKKIYDALNPSGVLFLATPDSHFIDELGVINFNHWFAENRIIYSKAQMIKLLEKTGFDVLMARANSSSRYIKNNDMHIIAQRGL